MAKDLDFLHRQLDYNFTDLSLLVQALKHRSVSGEHNERLEFLGDSILSFIMAQTLFDKFPRADEGALSRLRASLVKGETLTKIANELGINEFIQLGAGELRNGGQHRPSILAGTLEAIIGAIYLDAGIETAKKSILKWFDSRLSALSGTKVPKDPKSTLQEYLQAKHHELPTYTVVSLSGEAHEQIFDVTCQVAGLVFQTRGQGNSRRQAEQAAAAAFMRYLEAKDVAK